MKLLFTILSLAFIILFASCDSNENKEDVAYKEFIRQKKIDSITKANLKDFLFDTVGVSNAPIHIINDTILVEDYSKCIRIMYKNITDKKIDGIRFRWYGETVFGEAADMGGVEDGFGGGFTDEPTKPNEIKFDRWDLPNVNAKRIKLAWPIEVVFSDGTKWKSSH